MNRQTARVTDIRDMIEELEPIDEAPSRVMSAGKFETEQAAIATGQDRIRAFPAEIGQLFQASAGV